MYIAVSQTAPGEHILRQPHKEQATYPAWLRHSDKSADDTSESIEEKTDIPLDRNNVERCQDGATGKPEQKKPSLHPKSESKGACKATCTVPREPNSKRSALRRHCDFWDADHDGLIYPWDIYTGFRRLGFHVALCLWAAVSMPLCSSYGTQPGWIPHPLFAIRLDNIHRSRHGSTTTTYDLDAEIDMRRFDAIFTKYGEGKDYLTLRTLYNVWAGQCCANDWFGWFAGGLEWIALYILIWPEDGRLWRGDILGVFDGSIFEKIATQRSQQPE